LVVIGSANTDKQDYTTAARQGCNPSDSAEPSGG
jgi:hypothetical protein